MARTVAEYLQDSGADITRVIASPLLRAQQSAAPTAQAYDLPIQADSRLLESNNVFEGLPVNRDRLLLAKPQFWRHYRHPLTPSWGEPYAQVAQRMSAALSTAVKEARGHEALVVSHQMPIVTLTRFAQMQPLQHAPWSRQCALASLTSFIFEGATLVGISYTEPAADLVKQAQDMTPGKSGAELKR